MTTTIIITDSREFTEEQMEKLYTCWGIYKSATRSSMTLNEFIGFCCTPCPVGDILTAAQKIARNAVS